eukprot:UN15153
MYKIERKRDECELEFKRKRIKTLDIWLDNRSLSNDMTVAACLETLWMLTKILQIYGADQNCMLYAMRMTEINVKL